MRVRVVEQRSTGGSTQFIKTARSGVLIPRCERCRPVHRLSVLCALVAVVLLFAGCGFFAFHQRAIGVAQSVATFHAVFALVIGLELLLVLGSILGLPRLMGTRNFRFKLRHPLVIRERERLKRLVRL